MPNPLRRLKTAKSGFSEGNDINDLTKHKILMVKRIRFVSLRFEDFGFRAKGSAMLWTLAATVSGASACLPVAGAYRQREGKDVPEKGA